METIVIKILSLLLGIKEVFAAGTVGGEGTVGDGISFQNPLGGGVDTFTELADKIIDFLLVVAAPIVVIMVIWAGFLFMTAGGNLEKVQKGKDTLLWTAVGVGVLMISKGVTTLLVSILGGN